MVHFRDGRRRECRPLGRAGGARAAGNRSRIPDVGDARGHCGQAALHRGRPREPRDGDPSSVSSPARRRAVRARTAGDHVREPAVDDPPVRGVLHRRGVERVLPAEPRGRADGIVGRVRPRDAPRLRQRPPARRRRRGQGGGGDRLRRGHEAAVRRHPARQDDRVDDDERRGAPRARRLRRRGRRARREPGAARRDHPERHPQRVHGPQHLHLSARTEHADRRRHHPVHGATHAEVQLDLDLRLPHARGGRDRGAGARFHACRRPGVRAHRVGARARRRRVRGPPLVLLRDRHELLHGGREAARGAPPVVADHDRPRSAEARLEDAAHALPDVGRVAHRAGPVQQRRAHRLRGARRGARRHAEPAHQQLRRGDRPPVRLRGAHRPQHAADPRRGDRRHARGRSARRLLLRRGAHPEPRQRGVAADRGGRAARRHDQGGRVGHAQAAHRGGRGPAPGARRPRRRDRRRRQQVPAHRRGADRRARHRQHGCAPPAARTARAGEGRARPAARGTGARRPARRRGRRRQPARAVDRGDTGPGDGRRDLRRDGERVRPPPRGDPLDLRCVRRRVRGRRGIRTHPQGGRRVRARRKAAARASSSPSSARTATTAAPR